MLQGNSNKKIVKNTAFLYFRSFLMLFINLYASRIILQALGVQDFGLYGAVGSMVAMFTIVNGSLSAGTSRFLTFELGKGNKEKLKQTFNASLAMHTCMAVVLLLLMETIGLWFVNYKMNIPTGREFAANVVYQMSVLSCMLSLTQVPYSATIISHERMDIYAYVGLVEAAFKLVLVFILLYLPFQDNLIAYAVIVSLWSVLLQIFYRVYCFRKFPETHLSLCRSRAVYKEMLSYSLWDTIGSFCATGNSHGTNLLINIFFSVMVNAARTVALQVQSAITLFSGNFMTAVNPQIVKSYAKKDYERFFQLIFNAGKYAYFLLFAFIFPLCLEIDYVLSMWLVEIPPYASLFVRLSLIITLIRVIVRPVITAVHATGNVKVLNLTSGIASAVTFLPLVYFVYQLGWPVWMCYIIEMVLLCLVCTYLEVRALYLNITFDRIDYLKRVFVKPVLVSLIPAVFTLGVYIALPTGFLRLASVSMMCLVILSVSVLFIDLNSLQRRKVFSFISQRLKSYLNI